MGYWNCGTEKRLWQYFNFFILFIVHHRRSEYEREGRSMRGRGRGGGGEGDIRDNEYVCACGGGRGCVWREGEQKKIHVVCHSLIYLSVSGLLIYSTMYMYYIIQYINNKYIFELASDTNNDNLSYKYLLWLISICTHNIQKSVAVCWVLPIWPRIPATFILV